MDLKKLASFSASWLIFGIAAFSGAAIAADPSAAQTGSSKPAVHDMTHQGDGHVEGMKCNHQDVMMKADVDGMKCDHKAGMKCDHEAGMKCDHEAMKCDHEAGMKCDHKAGMMSTQKPSMKCDHGAGMMSTRAGELTSGYDASMMGLDRMPLIMSLDLTDDQRSKIHKLFADLQRKNLATRNSIMQESAKLRDLYTADTRNPSAIGKMYQKISDMQRKMIEATVTAQNRIEEVLTPAQHTQLKDMRKDARLHTTDAHDHAAH